MKSKERRTEKEDGDLTEKSEMRKKVKGGGGCNDESGCSEQGDNEKCSDCEKSGCNEKCSEKCSEKSGDSEKCNDSQRRTNTDSHTTDSHTTDSHANDSHAKTLTDSHAKTPTDSHATDSHTTDSHTTDSHTTDSHAKTPTDSHATNKAIIKPFLRGRIHQFAFLLSLLLLLLHFLYSTIRHFHLATLIILTTQCILYGTSSFYHLTNFKSPLLERLVQRLDHTCIFLFIASVHSSMALTLNLVYKRIIIFVTWMFFAAGVLKIVLMERIFEALDVVMYIAHGVFIGAFLGRENFNVLYKVILPLGGALYIAGGIVFGIERPNLVPSVYGYHELFHTLTVLANICFLIPIVMFYIGG